MGKDSIGSIWLKFDSSWFESKLAEGVFFENVQYISSDIAQDLLDYQRGLEFMNAPTICFESRLLNSELKINEFEVVSNRKDLAEHVKFRNEYFPRETPLTVEEVCHAYDEDTPLEYDSEGFCVSPPYYFGEVDDSEWLQNLGVMDTHLNLIKLVWCENETENSFIFVSSASFAGQFNPEIFFSVIMQSIGISPDQLELEESQFLGVLNEKFPGVGLELREERPFW